MRTRVLGNPAPHTPCKGRREKGDSQRRRRILPCDCCRAGRRAGRSRARRNAVGGPRHPRAKERIARPDWWEGEPHHSSGNPFHHNDFDACAFLSAQKTAENRAWHELALQVAEPNEPRASVTHLRLKLRICVLPQLHELREIRRRLRPIALLV